MLAPDSWRTEGVPEFSFQAESGPPVTCFPKKISWIVIIFAVVSVSFKISKKDELLSIFAVVTVSFKISYKHGALWE